MTNMCMMCGQIMCIASFTDSPKLLSHKQSSCSLVPRPPPFCSSVCVQYNTWKHALPLSCIVLNTNRRTKTRKAWVNYLQRVVRTCISLVMLVSSPDSTYKRGPGDIQLIPQASLMLITFWREFLQYNTGNSWLLQHDDIALFWRANQSSVLNYAYSKL